MTSPPKNQPLTIAELLSAHARISPEKVALVDGRRRLTYRELARRAAALARALGGLGLVPGDRLAIWAPNRAEWLELLAACAFSGVVAVPISTRLTPGEVGAILEDCQPRAMALDPSLDGPAEVLREAQILPEGGWIRLPGGGSSPAGLRPYEALIAGAATAPLDPVAAAEDPWTIIYTSGTTGPPKGVVRSHRSFALSFRLNALAFGFSPDEVGLCVLPLYHVNSIFYGFTFLALGATTCVFDAPSFDPEQLLGVLAAEGVSFTSLVPTQCVRLLELPAATRACTPLPHLRRLLVSSAPARQATKEGLLDALAGVHLFEGYGSTEAGLVTLLRPEEQLRKPGSVGREIGGTGRIRLLDEARREVPDGEVGELFSLTPTAFDRYWGRPQLTSRAFDGAHCSAGDLARRDPEGYLTLVERKANLIISGGEKVYPAEVEEVLCQHPDLLEVAVVGLSHPLWGEQVTAAAVPRPGRRPTAEALLTWSRERLAGYKCPRALHLLRADQLPRGPTGKVLHRLLRARLQADRRP